eukprot:m.194261 g.194261  ORF g.194261 m.194261 type:complete len:1160 (-) comp19138_c0_seq1:40-3519(-)
MIALNLVVVLSLAHGDYGDRATADGREPLNQASVTSRAVSAPLPETLPWTQTTAGLPWRGPRTYNATSPPTTPCPAWQQCRATPSCQVCLAAIGPYVGTASVLLDVLNMRQLPVELLGALQGNASCADTGAQDVIIDTLTELFYSQECAHLARVYPNDCAVPTARCFADHQGQCGACLSTIYNGSMGSAAALNSSACLATNATLKQHLAQSCRTFPRCTWSKAACTNSSSCNTCLGMLWQGNVDGAVQSCPDGETQDLLDAAIESCAVGSTSCSYWQHRCADDAVCHDCLAAMSYGESQAAIVAGSLSPSCGMVRRNASLIQLLSRTFWDCPSPSSCPARTSYCVLSNEQCTACLNGSLPQSSETCQALLNASGYDVQYGCWCPVGPLARQNSLVIATSVVGSVSVVACLVVILLIVAHRRDVTSMHARIVLGLMVTSIAFSTGNAIPANLVFETGPSCSMYVMSLNTISFVRALWIGGKFGTVCYEIFIIGASTWALTGGMRRMSIQVEAVMHLLCMIALVGAFVGFLAQVHEDHGYTETAMQDTVYNQFTHLDSTDDLDDDEVDASDKAYARGKAQYDQVLATMLFVWNGFAGGAFVGWLVFRFSHFRLLQSWHKEMEASISSERDDEWAATRRAAYRTRRMTLEYHRAAYAEVARPLEPYVFVLLCFAVPAVFMSVPYCVSRSKAEFLHYGVVGPRNVTGHNMSGSGVFATCSLWCELIISFRSLATVIVFFASQERRAELWDIRRVWSLLVARLCGCRLGRSGASGRKHVYHAMGRAGSNASGTHIYDDDYDVELLQPSPSSSDPAVNHDVNTMHNTSGTTDTAAWQIAADDVELLHKRADGAFGVVWEARWSKQPHQHVAVKLLKSAITDEEGDLLDPLAEQDFVAEVAMLCRIRHVNVVEFHGCGRTATGQAFICTELMKLGSLRDLLLDNERALPWPTRFSIALQLSLGMEHLHSVPVVHRDLKSANVLVDEAENGHIVTKVADFGSSRRLRPPRARVVFSAFTGTARVVSASDSDTTFSETGVSVDVLHDAHGTMTKAVGTPLWMAPEVFRGDTRYGGAVDVYSFGIILWEIAMRQTPWSRIAELDGMDQFLQLNDALKKGLRPEISKAVAMAHPSYVDIMQRCWAGDPADRPTFASTSTELSACLRATSQ